MKSSDFKKLCANYVQIFFLYLPDADQFNPQFRQKEESERWQISGHNSSWSLPKNHLNSHRAGDSRGMLGRKKEKDQGVLQRYRGSLSLK